MRRYIFCLIFACLVIAVRAENLWAVPAFSLKANEAKSPPRVIIESRQRYYLEFRGRSSGVNNVENSPVLDELLQIRFPKMTPLKMPQALLIVNSGDNKNCLPAHVERRIYIYSSEWQTYKLEFYAPDTAKFLNLRFDSADGLEVKDISLQKVTGAEILNINPDLGMNKYYFPGYGEPHKTIIQEDGSLDSTAGWLVGDPIAVEPGERLKLTVVGESPKRLLIRTNFYRDPPNDKNFISRNKTAIAISGKKKTIEYTVMAPPETRWLRLSFSAGILYHVKVEKIKE